LADTHTHTDTTALLHPCCACVYGVNMILCTTVAEGGSCAVCLHLCMYAAGVVQSAHI